MKIAFDLNMKYGRAILTGLIVAASLSTTATASEAGSTPFTMAVVTNDAHGSEVKAGKYELAINRITRQGRRLSGNFAEQVNLCVAYTKTGKVERASAACDAAIAKVKKQPDFRRDSYDLALALSNRGVLMAAMGDHESAKQDFLGAIELDTQLTSIATTNLERLDRLAAS